MKNWHYLYELNNKSFLIDRLDFDVLGVHSQYFFVISLVVLLLQLHVLVVDRQLRALKANHSHSLRVDLVKSLHEVVGVFSSKARVKGSSFI